MVSVRQPRLGFAGARLELIFSYPGAFRLFRRGCVWKSTGKKDTRTKITVCRRCARKGQHIG